MLEDKTNIHVALKEVSLLHQEHELNVLIGHWVPNAPVHHQILSHLLSSNLGIAKSFPFCLKRMFCIALYSLEKGETSQVLPVYSMMAAVAQAQEVSALESNSALPILEKCPMVFILAMTQMSSLTDLLEVKQEKSSLSSSATSDLQNTQSPLQHLS